jgi:lysophosphatidate acyltransferase
MPFLGPAILISIVALPLLHFAPRTASLALASLLPTIMLSRFFSPVRYYLRLTTFLLGLAANSAWGVIVSIALSVVGKSMNINWVVARSFRMSTAPLCGIRFKVEGQEHLEAARPAVLVGNHQTMLDILCSFFPISLLLSS